MIKKINITTKSIFLEFFGIFYIFIIFYSYIVYTTKVDMHYENVLRILTLLLLHIKFHLQQFHHINQLQINQLHINQIQISILLFLYF